MESIVKTEIIISGGALLISAGGIYYINNRVNELEQNIGGLSEKIARLIQKTMANEGQNNIISNNLDNMNHNIEHLKKEFNKLNDILNSNGKLVDKHHNAIMELQKLIVTLIDENQVLDNKLKTLIKTKKGKKGKKGKKSERDSSDSDKDSSDSSSSKSSDSDNDDDIKKRMNKLKSK